MPERLGILGGTFDPVHVGHLVAAVDARFALGLDRVLLVPAGDPWQKRGQVVASKHDRVEMARLAAADVAGVEVSTVEVDHDRPAVTADTLEALAAADRDLFLLLGADAVNNMPTWRRLEETRSLTTVVAIERAGERATPPGEGWRLEHVAIPRLDVSSSEIRARIAAGRPIDGLTPPTVVQFINQHGLYTSP